MQIEKVIQLAIAVALAIMFVGLYGDHKESQKQKTLHTKYLESTTVTAEIKPYDNDWGKKYGPFLAEKAPEKVDDTDIWVVRWSYYPFNSKDKRYDTSITEVHDLKPRDPIQIRRLVLKSDFNTTEVGGKRSDTIIVVRAPNTDVTTPPQQAEKP